MIDKKCLKQSASFCPIMVNIDDVETMYTRCDEWLEKNNLSSLDYSNENDDNIVLWNINEEKQELLSLNSIKTYYITTYKGKMYFK